MNLMEERHQIEARHPGWHVWVSDAGLPYATRATDGFLRGSGVTLDLPGMARADQVIAAFDRALANGWNPWAAVADAVTAGAV
jgi:hypothetical protein